MARSIGKWDSTALAGVGSAAYATLTRQATRSERWLQAPFSSMPQVPAYRRDLAPGTVGWLGQW